MDRIDNLRAALEDARKRVLQFDMLELPGQPQGMHMGTSYLVHDLLRIAEALSELSEDPRTAEHDSAHHEQRPLPQVPR